MSFYRENLAHTSFSGRRIQRSFVHSTYFPPNFGHAINAVLVGDNPLNFDDWRFIEPQTDESVSPASGHAVWIAGYHLCACRYLLGGAVGDDVKVEFLPKKTE
jgi:hypothetical protein